VLCTKYSASSWRWARCRPFQDARAGVVLTAESFAAVLIAALAGPWSEIDERVVALFKAPADFTAEKYRYQRWLDVSRARSPDLLDHSFRERVVRHVTERDDPERPGFLEAVALAISDPEACGIRVSRMWRGQIVFHFVSLDEAQDYVVRDADGKPVPRPPVSITAEIEEETFRQLAQAVQRALGSE
jgi:hypothetical protein